MDLSIITNLIDNFNNMMFKKEGYLILGGILVIILIWYGILGR